MVEVKKSCPPLGATEVTQSRADNRPEQYLATGSTTRLTALFRYEKMYEQLEACGFSNSALPFSPKKHCLSSGAP